MLIGILGGGQLARMLALAGYPFGFRFRVLDPAADCPASRCCELVQGAYDDPAALETFAAGCDVITYEFENVPAIAVRRLAGHAPIHPSPRALEVGQDRLFEKSLFKELGLGVHDFAAVETHDELRAAAESLGLPMVVKTRRMGYDGKGQMVVRTAADVERCWQMLGGRPLLAEKFVRFEREVSIIAARSAAGEIRCYPLAENTHEDGILRLSRIPANVPDSLQQQAEMHIAKVMEKLDYVGVLTIEFFVVAGANGAELLTNEMAPRVHNSGHWTIEGAHTSQFENHIRAVAGLPLGDTTARGPAAMINLIGRVLPAAEVLKVPNAHPHLYDKEERPGRKVGHITVVGGDSAAVDASVKRMTAMIGG